MRRTGRVIVVFFLVFFCMAGLWLFQSFRESRVVKTKKEYRNVYITDVKQQKVEGIWRGQKKNVAASFCCFQRKNKRGSRLD